MRDRDNAWRSGARVGDDADRKGGSAGGGHDSRSEGSHGRVRHPRHQEGVRRQPFRRHCQPRADRAQGLYLRTRSVRHVRQVQDHQGQKKPDCPADSLLGTAEITVYLPALHGSASSDAGYVWKTGPHSVAAWNHVSQPVEIAAAVFAEVKPPAGSDGPIINWDFGPAAHKEVQNLEVRVARFQVAWKPADSAAPTTPTASPKPASSRSKKYAACMRKAKKIKNKKKRAKAQRACQRKYGKKSSGRAVEQSRDSATASAFSPFMSTACTGDGWTQQSRLTYLDETSETVQAKIDCTTGTDGSDGAGGLLDGILPPPGR